MQTTPETKLARNGNVALANQVFGEEPVDLVYLQTPSHVDLNWESPYLARFLNGLGQRARVIHTDRRGFGWSVMDLVAGSGLRFVDAGEHELKGVPDRWRLPGGEQ